MPDIRNAWDAEMMGRNKFADWQAKFMAKWHDPEMVAVQAMWQKIRQTAAPGVIEAMKSKMDPDMRAIMEGFDNGNNVAK